MRGLCYCKMWTILVSVFMLLDLSFCVIETPRITLIGNESVSLTEVQFVVSLWVIEAQVPSCTGSIIDRQWVLSAAHCIDSRPCHEFEVAAAGLTANEIYSLKESSMIQKRRLQRCIPHPKYWQGKASKYDIAIMKVIPFVFNDLTQKIELWAQPWVKSAEKLEYGILHCMIYGWGLEKTGGSTSKLRKAQVVVRHGAKACLCFPMYMQRRMICGEPNTRGGLCFGDSGGPLVCNKKLAGVAHVLYRSDTCRSLNFGVTKLECEDPNAESGWMYVCPMLDFIHQHVPFLPQQPASCRSAPTKTHLLWIVLVNLLFLRNKQL